jgi:hypothetical protein
MAIWYGAFCVSESNVAAVRKYIAEQQEHHRPNFAACRARQSR